jgi:hypothetical protein
MDPENSTQPQNAPIEQPLHSPAGKEPTQPPPKPPAPQGMVFEKKIGINELIALVALVVASAGLIYQHRALISSEKELNTKINDVAELTRRLDEETKKAAQTDRRLLKVHGDFVDYSVKVAFMSLTLRSFDALFQGEINYGVAIAAEASMRLGEVSPQEQQRIREHIVFVADMNRILTLKMYEHTQATKKEFDEMERLGKEAEGKNLTLDELVDLGGRLKLILGPKLVELGTQFQQEIREPFATRKKHIEKLEQFMKDRNDAYEAGKKQTNSQPASVSEKAPEGAPK